MEPIRKKILTDEAHHPIAVQLDYSDWLRIEPLLRERGLLKEEPTDVEGDLEALAEAARPYWQGGDGLEYQQTIREEWENRP